MTTTPSLWYPSNHTYYYTSSTPPLPPDTPTLPHFNHYLDIFIAAILTGSLLIGVAGNIPAFLYFVTRRSLPALLYSVISGVDIWIAVSAFPLILTLSDNREPGILEKSSFVCRSTLIISTISQKISMFSVMLISLTRTILIISPYKTEIRKRTVVMVICVYSAVLVTIDTVYISLSWLHPTYRKWAGFCVYETALLQSTSTYYFVTTTTQLELLLPVVIVFTSFVAGTAALLSARAPAGADLEYRTVSVTIAMFTAVFLACYLPYFVTQLVLVSEIYGLWDTSSQILSNPGFKWYGTLLANCLMRLNTALNPCLYLLRMPGYRKWLRLLVKHPEGFVRLVKDSSRAQRLYSVTGTKPTGKTKL